MTTNKPEVVGHANAEQIRHFKEWGGHLPRLLEEPTPTTVPLIRLSDYEALQAECEKLREHLQSMIDQTTPLEPVPGNPMWSRRIQLDEVIAERDRLRVECEKLRKDAETERAIQRAAEALPPGLSIEIEIEKGAVLVSLLGPGSRVSCDFQGSLAEQINDAIDAAIQGDQP